MNENQMSNSTIEPELLQPGNQPVPPSISRRLTVSLILAVVTVSAFVIIANYFYASRKAQIQLNNKADEYIAFLTDSLSLSLWSYDSEYIRQIGSVYSQNDLVAGLTIKDSFGSVYFHTLKDDSDVQVIRKKNIFYKKKWVGSVELSLTLQAYKNIQEEFLLQSIIPIIAGLIVITVLTGFLLRTLLRKPLDQLNQIAESYASGSYDISTYPRASAEFQPFIAVLEKMNKKLNLQMSRLQAAEEKYRSIFENAADGIFQSSIKGQFISSNQALALMLGYDSAENLKSSITNIAQQLYADPSQREDIISHLAKNETLSGRELQLLKKDGSKLSCLLTARLVRDSDSNILFIEGFLKDISLRKSAAQELQREKAFLIQLFENPLEAIAIGNVNQKLTMINKTFTHLFGYTSEEAIGKHIDDLITPDKFKLPFGPEIYDSQNTERSILETTRRHKDGSLIEVSVLITPIILNKKITGGFVIYRDITERKKAENALSSLRKYLSNIINSMPSVLVGVDIEGKVEQWNLEAEKATGIAADSAQGQKLKEVFPLLAKKMDNVAQAIQNRKIHRDSKISHQVNGETRFSELTVYPLITNGIEGAVIRVDDITDRMRIEEMMIQSEKMISVGRLAAGMAHEINNPLAGILQNIQVIQNRLSSDIKKNIITAKECGVEFQSIRTYVEKRDIFRMIDSVVKSGRRASKIVANMLSFSRMGKPEKTKNNLIELIDKTIDLASSDYDLKKKYDFRKINIVREYAQGQFDIYCEHGKIQQVFLNILKNSAQAMMTQKENKEPPQLIIRVYQEEDMIRTEIQDNGPGMDKEIRKRVFEPFFTTKDVGLGTGLGLSVSYFIITENHNGTMSVESKPGKGAKFIVRLPVG